MATPSESLIRTAREPKALRELGVYSTPDGDEVVVSTLYSDGFSLYSARSWVGFGNAEFWVNEEGQLLRRGVPTRWHVRDLEDTGRTTTYPKPLIL